MTDYSSGTVTFLFTDIEGSSKSAREHPEIWDDVQARHHAILHGAIESNNGFVFQIVGDAFYAALNTVGDVLDAALMAQEDLLSELLGAAVIRVRMPLWILWRCAKTMYLFPLDSDQIPEAYLRSHARPHRHPCGSTARGL